MRVIDFPWKLFQKTRPCLQRPLPSLVEQMVKPEIHRCRRREKLPVSAYYDNRYVDELEKEGVLQKLWQ